MNRLFACFLLAASASASTKEDYTVKTMYCVQGPGKEWLIQPSKPLIDMRRGTVFSEISLAGGAIEEMKLRRFYPAAEVNFDYKFDATGKLNSLMGTVSVFGEWLGEANLFPDSDGTIPPYHVVYTRGSSRIAKPDNAVDFIDRLDDVPIYRTNQAVPCAASLKDAREASSSTTR